jgi:uncharacterized protein (DUF2062 family)
VTGRVGRALRVLLHVDGSPHRTAAAFGLGLFIAFFPVLGIHTGMALLLAFAFRLSRVAILTGAYVNNPWTLAPLYTLGTVVGCALLAVPPEGLLHVDWRLLASLRPYLWPFIVGNLVCGLAAGVAGYVGLRLLLERRRAV